MRIVAGFAPVHAQGRMFEDEWPGLITMAVYARLIAGTRLVHHTRADAGTPSRSESAVGVVTIGALNYAFVDAMLDRHVELRAHGGVALVAQIPLELCQQELGSLRFMNRMS